MLQLLQPAGTDRPSCRANQLLTSPDALYGICSYKAVHKITASHGLVALSTPPQPVSQGQHGPKMPAAKSASETMTGAGVVP